jgi:hypothetical protein
MEVRVSVFAKGFCFCKTKLKGKKVKGNIQDSMETSALELRDNETRSRHWSRSLRVTLWQDWEKSTCVNSPPS